jgi:acetyl-CoA acyltransferase
MANSSFIVDAVRTVSGKGKRGGHLSGMHAVDLLGSTLRELVTRAGIEPGDVDDVIAGCVTQGGEQGGNIARNAVLSAGFPDTVPGTTVDRQCGSSQQALHFAAQGIAAGAYDIAIACGVEMMSRTPMFSQYQGQDTYGPTVQARYAPGLVAQGLSAEMLAVEYGLSRQALDAFAAESHRRAAQTWAEGGFDREVFRDHTGVEDETVRGGTTTAKLATLPPAFADEEAGRRFGIDEWRVTAGNSSPFTDGASAVLLMSQAAMDRYGLRPRASFRSFAVLGDDPVRMLRGVVPTTQLALKRAGLVADDVDLFEVNEAFATVPLLWMRDLQVDADRVNPRGGAIALGHPLGSSGTRVATTLLHAMEDKDKTLGLQVICEGGGMANAMVIERV